ncbi:MAG: ABC transporter permease, partial [Verrucomicrobiota bacterium]|nr:ABC transporter permease [Verrucomicrobiota bacterium]
MSDLKYAFRTLLKSPPFTIVAVLTLALGIGASTTIFSVLDAVLLRPLPYPDQERIVELRELDEKGHGMSFAEPNYEDVRNRSRSFAAIAKYTGTIDSAVAGGSEPVRSNTCAVSDDFFRVLGVAPLVGRLFSAGIAEESNQAVVVSYGFWKRVLAGRTNLEGATLRFQNRSFAVIGVLPPDVEFPPRIDIWFPAKIFPPNPSRSGHNWRVAARLRDGVSFEQARAEIASIGQQLKRNYGTETDAASFAVTPLRERMVKDVRSALWLLCGAVALLLMIACSNVANLLLVRANARRKEVALRAALGASRGRLACQFMVETLLLTLLAGALGMMFAVWGVGLIVGFYQGNLPRVGQISIDGEVLIFSVGVSFILGLVLGLVPLASVSRARLQDELASRGVSISRSSSRVRNFLIVGQIALTLTLLVGAGLLARSFQRLLEVDPGFQPESAVAMNLSLPEPEEPLSPTAVIHLAQFYQQLLERVEMLPGVVSVGGVNALPLSGNGANGGFIIENGGKPAQTLAELEKQYSTLAGTERLGYAEFRIASAGYFPTVGIPLLRGRLFQDSDASDAPHEALVSQSLARRYWPNEDAVGRHIQFGGMDGDLHLLHIVGIVGDVHDEGLDAQVLPTVYVNYRQRPRYAAQFSIVLRGHGDPAGFIAAMRREARALNPEMPVEFQTLTQVVAASLDHRRFTMAMLGVFAGAALLLAMVGLYGVMAYITSQRTHEIGIRMALGAQRLDMLRMILRQSFALVFAGVALGIFASLGLTRLLATMLYGVQATDVVTYTGVVGLLVLAA